MKRYRLLILVIFSVFGCTDATAPRLARARFMAVVDSLRTAHHLTALAAAIVTADSTVQASAVGRRRIDRSTRVTITDRFSIGSVFKHQVAVLTARLAAQGVLDWDRTLAAYFPESALGMQPTYAAATLRDLLSHTAGFPRDSRFLPLPSDPVAARADVVRAAFETAPVGPRGRFSYSNVGYLVVGAIIERRLQRPFEQVVREQLWAPLGMVTAGWGVPSADGMSQPVGHLVGGGGIPVPALTTSADVPHFYGPAGRAHMSIQDLATFMTAYLGAASGRASAVLGPEAWRALQRGHVGISSGLSYGYGWYRSTTDGTAWHDGTNGRSFSMVFVAPGSSYAVVAVTNEMGPRTALAVDAVIARLSAWQDTGR